MSGQPQDADSCLNSPEFKGEENLTMAKASLSLSELVSSAEDTIRRVHAQSEQLEVISLSKHLSCQQQQHTTTIARRVA